MPGFATPGNGGGNIPQVIYKTAWITHADLDRFVRLLSIHSKPNDRVHSSPHDRRQICGRFAISYRSGEKLTMAENQLPP